MSKKEKRFVQIYQEDSSLLGPSNYIIVDKETGVTYLLICNMCGSGVTPLLDKDGKPVITKLN